MFPVVRWFYLYQCHCGTIVAHINWHDVWVFHRGPSYISWTKLFINAHFKRCSVRCHGVKKAAKHDTESYIKIETKWLHLAIWIQLREVWYTISDVGHWIACRLAETGHKLPFLWYGLHSDTMHLVNLKSLLGTVHQSVDFLQSNSEEYLKHCQTLTLLMYTEIDWPI